MFCQKCGKQISDQSRFCNYCGSPVAPAPAGGGNSAGQPAAAAPPKKKNGLGSAILSIVLVVAVFLAVQYLAENAAKKKLEQAPADTGSPSLLDIANSGKDEVLPPNEEITDAMDSCCRGAIYEDGELRYGLTKLSIPGYSLLPAAEGEDRDYLISPDGIHLVAATWQAEIIDVSYEASDGQSICDSYAALFPDAAMEGFEKYYVNGYPVVRYIVRYTADGVSRYHGELVIFPAAVTDETIRLAVFADVAYGLGTDGINKIFDTLQVSHEFRVTENDTNVIGFNRITVK